MLIIAILRCVNFRLIRSADHTQVLYTISIAYSVTSRYYQLQRNACCVHVGQIRPHNTCLSFSRYHAEHYTRSSGSAHFANAGLGLLYSCDNWLPSHTPITLDQGLVVRCYCVTDGLPVYCCLSRTPQAT